MCGIVGAVGLDQPPDPDVQDSVIGSLEHRGPDAGGAWFGQGVWLGFRRLSILDLSSRADQPMVDPASGVAIVYNGELYNYLELRRDLEAQGASFATTGDTEVLLRGYLRWGDGLFERCNGMWAVAVCDPSRAGVLLCRDRFGEKPLHLGRHPTGSWWFASEPTALRAAGVGTGRPDVSRLLGFLALGDIEDPARSYLEGIDQVEPGTSLHLTPDGPVAPRRWWRLADVVQEAWSAPPLADEEVRARLDEAVALRLRSDVAVGTSLSGGIDSSAVVASLRAVDPSRELHAFTASFPGQPIDEWDRAAIVGRRFGLALHRVEPTPTGFLADLDVLVDRQGGPIESPTVYAQWCVFRAAHDAGVTVLLDGQGADETWGGYPKHVGFAIGDLLLHGRLDRARRALALWRRLGSLPAPDVRQAAGLLLPGAWRAPARSALVDRRRGVLGPIFDGVATTDPQGSAVGGLLERAAVADLGRVVLPRLLRYADRNSMAWGREVRLPFLDPAVLDAGLRSDWSAGMAQGWTKLALRRVASVRLPDAIVWRRDKTAYETPDAAWLARPDVDEAVRQAARSLTSLGVLRRPEAAGLSPWRVLSLSRFLDRYGLVP